MATQLDAPVSKKELQESISSIKNNKGSSLDGLPREFYKMFHKHLCDSLRKVREEALFFKGLIDNLNTRVIKLIHKNGGKKYHNQLEAPNYAKYCLQDLRQNPIYYTIQMPH